ncbi:hypothetical protein DTL42_20565 [Bremerella cremea]|uniref:Uncharacterized protein n=1 Tax=Bremerella cremea TaxID=1031537 RepID=A0A368KPL1_9BACT|nr:hypothetical protein DTL42_20565 [Bremerella cremea]
MQVLLFVIRLLLAVCPFKVEVLSPVRVRTKTGSRRASSQRETAVVNLPLLGWLEIDAHLIPHNAWERARQGSSKRAGPTSGRSSGRRHET